MKSALKYGNAITEVDGIRFDSRKEAKYYEDLLWQQRTGAVKSIELQPEFVLQPGYEVAGKKIRPIIYKVCRQFIPCRHLLLLPIT